MRFLFYLAIAYVLWVALSAILKAVVAGRSRAKKLSGEDLVSCANCGTYVPSSTAVRRKGRDFCGADCASGFKADSAGSGQG